MLDPAMPSEIIPSEISCWWRITETGTWFKKSLDILGPGVLSLTGRGDRLRVCPLLVRSAAGEGQSGTHRKTQTSRNLATSAAELALHGRVRNAQLVLHPLFDEEGMKGRR